MRANGKLQAEKRVDGGLNEHGEPNGDAVSWGDPVPCAIEAVSDNRLGKYEDGEFRQSSYSVLVEGSGFEADRIRLVRGSEELGEFRVVSITPLWAGRTKILV